MQLKKRLVKKIRIPKIVDDCLLMYVQSQDHLPFAIKRVFYITSANTKLPRGFHAHKKLKQVLFCIQGSVRLILDNGKKRTDTIINKPHLGVLIDNMIWHEMHDFKKDTILLIFASRFFEPEDYIRDYGKFKKKAAKFS